MQKNFRVAARNCLKWIIQTLLQHKRLVQGLRPLFLDGLAPALTAFALMPRCRFRAPCRGSFSDPSPWAILGRLFSTKLDPSMARLVMTDTLR